MHEPSASTFCSCTNPLPVQRASHKGAAETVCTRCEKPLRLTLSFDEQRNGPRWAA